MRRLFAALLTLAAVVGGVGVARAQTPEGSIGIRLVDAPTARRDDPRARVYIVDHVAPGTTISRRVEISNETSASQHIDTYPAAASVKDGGFRFGDGRARNELSTWTTVEPGEGEYAAAEKRIATVTIAVPKDASEGERYEVIWASVGAAAPTGGGIAEVNRVGIRVYLSVGPGGEPPSNFTIKSLQARRRNGVPEVTAVVKNTGGRALDLTGDLALNDGPGGLRAGPFPANLNKTLGIGDAATLTVKLDKAIPSGPWKAKLTLESGLTKRSASGTLTFPTSGATNVDTDPASNYTAPITAALAVAAAGAFFLVWRRRRSNDEHD